MPKIPTTYERKWPTVILAPVSISNHIFTVSSTAGLHSKQKITLRFGSLPPLELEIKRILSDTQFQAGHIGKDMTTYENPVAYNGGTIEMHEQNRNPMGWDIVGRAVYEEEPAVALRSVLVDRWGVFYNTDNPLPVQLTDGSINIGTVNAELEVQLSHKDNDPDIGDVHDSVRVGNGEYEMAVNPDGSINVNIIQSPSNIEKILSVYDEVLNVPANIETTVVTFTPPSSDRNYNLQRIEFTGTQIATYYVYINNIRIGTMRTHHGSGLSGRFEFVGATQEGLPINYSDIIELRAIHERVGLGQFEGRIQIYEAI